MIGSWWMWRMETIVIHVLYPSIHFQRLHSLTTNLKERNQTCPFYWTKCGNWQNIWSLVNLPQSRISFFLRFLFSMLDFSGRSRWKVNILRVEHVHSIRFSHHIDHDVIITMLGLVIYQHGTVHTFIILYHIYMINEGHSHLRGVTVRCHIN